ncbi:hypothetical protein TELCIR_11427 [Teladorsagia circumcincta]|uniref:Uncharacterized protein n=1 Tax=Teladorsagia circumcincta TaxID=45464 RepID=A0A2G9U9F5_TELCI|nr:hypothetical protein TELCIR_11427 [Teladorsagia circumcincta]
MYRQNRCYSCMSPMYEEFFKNGLDRYFTPPKNFSYQCDEPMNPESMHLVSCRTICLTVQQDLYVMGQPTGKRLFMRGCALTMARRGLNNHTLSMFDRYDICSQRRHYYFTRYLHIVSSNSLLRYYMFICGFAVRFAK